ncbi:MAG: hypothetical protein QGH60_04025 [Phycisphaerae bacterium]|jgi:hypothetical protein|nr:hypothetical protein [Phycisphaerae bacterium]
MEIEDAITHLIEAASSEEASEASIYEALAAASIPEDQADRLYKFTQIAWSREFFDGMGIRFSEEYYCFDANGLVIESGLLDNEPHFKFAATIARQHKGSSAFEQLILNSSEFDSVNQALNAGSNPKDLVMIPSILFMESPSEAGIENVQDFIAQHLESLRANATKKPKWKFWG